MVSGSIQLVALAVVLLALAAGLIVIALHIVHSDVDPRLDGVSAYALGSTGRWYRLEVIATGLAAVLLALALVAGGHGCVVGLALLVVFGASRILIARYPTDPRGATSLSRAGRLHIVLAAISFVTIAIAAPLISRDLVLSPGWTGPAMPMTALAWATTVFALGTFASATVPSARRVFGLVERGAFAAMLGWLAVASVAAGGLI
jgi:hypothetical protein